MSIQKRSRSQFYWYDFRLYGDRYQGSTKCTSERAAEKYETALKSQLMHARIGIDIGPKSTPTLKEFRKKFLAHCEATVEPESCQYYQSKFDNGALAWKPLAECELQDIDEDLIDRFVAVAQKRVGLRTTNHYLRTLRKALRLAKRWKLIKKAPEVRLLAGETAKDYRPSPETKEAYLAHAKRRFPDLYDAAILGLEAGPRLKELRTLKIEDVHLHAFGSKTGYIHFRAAEGDPSNRDVPLTDVAREMLSRRIKELGTREGKHKTKFVFPSPRSGARVIAHETIEGEHLTVRRELVWTNASPFTPGGMSSAAALATWKHKRRRSKGWPGTPRWLPARSTCTKRLDRLRMP